MFMLNFKDCWPIRVTIEKQLQNRNAYLRRSGRDEEITHGNGIDNSINRNAETTRVTQSEQDDVAENQPARVDSDGTSLTLYAESEFSNQKGKHKPPMLYDEKECESVDGLSFIDDLYLDEPVPLPAVIDDLYADEPLPFSASLDKLFMVMFNNSQISKTDAYQ